MHPVQTTNTAFPIAAIPMLLISVLEGYLLQAVLDEIYVQYVGHDAARRAGFSAIAEPLDSLAYVKLLYCSHNCRF